MTLRERPQSCITSWDPWSFPRWLPSVLLGCSPLQCQDLRGNYSVVSLSRSWRGPKNSLSSALETELSEAVFGPSPPKNKASFPIFWVADTPVVNCLLLLSCIAVRLQSVLQCFWCPTPWGRGKHCQYCSHLYRCTLPISIAICLPFLSQCSWENLGGCDHRDVPQKKERDD